LEAFIQPICLNAESFVKETSGCLFRSLNHLLNQFVHKLAVSISEAA